MLNAGNRARLHPLLFKICEYTYESIVNSGDQLITFQEHFNSLPRAVLECSARDQLLPEADLILFKNRLHTIESEAQNLAFSLEQLELHCASLQRQLSDLQESRSWKVTAPLRALFGFLSL